MLNRRVFGLIVLVLFFFQAHSQPEVKGDTTYVNDLLAKSKALFGEDPEKAIATARQAHDAAVKIGF
jgi:hypothetical protein